MRGPTHAVSERRYATQGRLARMLLAHTWCLVDQGNKVFCRLSCSLELVKQLHLAQHRLACFRVQSWHENSHFPCCTIAFHEHGVDAWHGDARLESHAAAYAKANANAAGAVKAELQLVHAPPRETSSFGKMTMPSSPRPSAAAAFFSFFVLFSFSPSSKIKYSDPNMFPRNLPRNFWLPSRCMSPFSAAVICAYPTNKTSHGRYRHPSRNQAQALVRHGS